MTAVVVRDALRGITLSAFETTVRKHGFTPLQRQPTKHGDVLMAERYFNTDPEFPQPHYQIVWTIAQAGIFSWQTIYFPFGCYNQKQRVLETMKAAKQWIEDATAPTPPEAPWAGKVLNHG